MATVQRGNVVLTVKDESINYYLDRGYDVVNDHGEVVIATIPDDKLKLQHEYVRLRDENEALKKEIEQLKQSLTTKSSKKSK